MSKKLVSSVVTACLVSLLIVSGGQAAPLETFIESLKEEAKKVNPDFIDFSAERGREFFNSVVDHPEEPFKRACFSCHTKDLKQTGTHPVSGKLIEPLSPSANPKRLSEVKKVKKWFKRNCRWVLQRACSPLEKGDFLFFLKST